MDIEKLIEQLKYYGTTYAIGDNLGKEIDGSDELMLDAAITLSTLQDENERLQVELEQVKRERDAAVDCIYQIEDDLNRGNDNDWAREHIAEWESQKEANNNSD